MKITRRKFIQTGAITLAGVTVAGPKGVFAMPSFDLIVKNGWILDGTGGPAWKGDIGISGEIITVLDTIDPSQGKRILDASGMYVCPGFIDIHSHSDGYLYGYPEGQSRVLQGITTELAGNCGYSASPLTGVGAEDRRKNWEENEGIDASWTDLASYFSLLESEKISLNHAILLGQGTLRENLIGNFDRELTSDELRAILRAVEEGMDQGAFGISTGLEYTPGRYTPTDEIVEMARVVSRRGGLYASHIRNEESTLLEAVDEAIEIGRRSQARVEVSHLKAAGRMYWSKQRASLELIESARTRGVEVLADAYPYTAYSTDLTVLFESWALEGDAAALIERLKDRSSRARIRKEFDARVPKEPGGYDLIVISEVKREENRFTLGLNGLEIAEHMKMEPADALLKLLETEGGSLGYIGHGMSPENVRMVLSHPLVMIGSDGLVMAPSGKLGETKPHPRSYGTCPRILGHYCREGKLFDLPVAVHKMTAMPADQIGLHDRGRIAKGKAADLVVFDAAKVRDSATFQDPHRYPSGIEYVLVNGTVVVEKGQHTGARPGQVLRKA